RAFLHEAAKAETLALARRVGADLRGGAEILDTVAHGIAGDPGCRCQHHGAEHHQLYPPLLAQAAHCHPAQPPSSPIRARRPSSRFNVAFISAPNIMTAPLM